MTSPRERPRERDETLRYVQKENKQLKRLLRLLAKNFDVSPFISHEKLLLLTGACFTDLPKDVIHHICLFMDYRSIIQLSRGSRDFQKFCGTENFSLWRRIYRRDYKGDTCSFEEKKSDDDWGPDFAARLVGTRWISAPTPSPIRLVQHKGTITDLKFDDKNLLTASDDGTCILWNLPMFLGGQDWKITGQGLAQHHMCQEIPKPRVTLFGHSGPVYGVAFQGETVVTAGYDKTVKLWDIEFGNCQQTLRGHTGWINSVAIERIFAEDLIFSCSWDGTARVWKMDEHSASVIEALRLDSVTEAGVANPNHCMSWNATCGKIAVGCQDGTINVWDIEKGKIVSSYQTHSKQCYAVEFEKHLITSGSKDFSIVSRDIRMPDKVRTYEHQGPVLSMSTDEHKIICGGTSKGIRIFDKRNTRRRKDFYPHSHAVFAVKHSEHFLITGGADAACLLFDWSARSPRNF